MVALASLLIFMGAMPFTEHSLATLGPDLKDPPREFSVGPLWVWMAYHENPGTTTLVGGAVVLAAVVYQATERLDDPAEVVPVGVP